MIPDSKLTCLYSQNFKIQPLPYTILSIQYKTFKTSQKLALNQNSYLMALFCIDKDTSQGNISKQGNVTGQNNDIRPDIKIISGDQNKKYNAKKRQFLKIQKPKKPTTKKPKIALTKKPKISKTQKPGNISTYIDILIQAEARKIKKSGMEKSCPEKSKKSLGKILKKGFQKVEGEVNLSGDFLKTEKKFSLSQKKCLTKNFNHATNN